MTSTDWSAWHHDAYGGRLQLQGRLNAVRAHIDRRLDATAPDPVGVISACAGDGRDLLGVIAGRSDADRVTALLVEYDAELVARAREAAEALTARVDVQQADAAKSDVYADAVPADLVLLCGTFGNVSIDDVRRTVEAAPQLCAPGTEVVWTRHRWEPDLTPSIRAWFAASGFEEIAFDSPGAGQWAVGVHRFTADPCPLEPGCHWFTFVR